MKIEQQVCSLEQAKELKQLGVEQDKSLFYWSDFNGGSSEGHVLCRRHKLGLYYDALDWFDKAFFIADYQKRTTYAAYTVAELGVLLPASCYTVYQPISREFYGYMDTNDLYCCDYAELGTMDENEAVVKATMLIYLLKNSTISAAQVNKHLHPKPVKQP